MVVDINNKLRVEINKRGDISDHLSYLELLSKQCNSILECGVRSAISSWAFLSGLMKHNSSTKTLHLCDVNYSNNLIEFEQACKEQNVEYMFHKCSDLDLPFKLYDMVFIDTWHVYGHLKRELAKFHSMATKYIVMHDTEVDKILGETYRAGLNVQQHEEYVNKLSIESGIPVSEITCGLQKAIDEFLAEHPEWCVKIQFTHNNGLTVLERT